MPVIRVETLIDAPVQQCFDLARDVEAHIRSTGPSRERAVGGVTSGLLALGDSVTWEAVHFGVRQRLTARITRFEPPALFEDEQVRGAFHAFTHRHEFRVVTGGTLMIDTFRYVAPLGILGRIANALFLRRYMRRFIVERARALREMAQQERAEHAAPSA
jgi:ligand-binding SRPBCC domain-containing protein